MPTQCLEPSIFMRHVSLMVSIIHTVSSLNDGAVSILRLQVRVAETSFLFLVLSAFGIPFIWLLY
jgi:hypothetical protein